MRYINEQDLRTVGADWEQLSSTITEALQCMMAKDYVQPLKPYLRFKHPSNRIIAMPAYIGGPFDIAGMKWIASFPDNPTHGLPRAHSVVVLNDADTGVPVALINGPLLSIVRTAAVSAVMLRKWLSLPAQRHDRPLNVCLVGCGPIGQWHARMLTAVLGGRLGRLTAYDLSQERAHAVAALAGEAGHAASDWQEAYHDADIVVTCTVSGTRYIDAAPKPGSLLLHVSLRDYAPAALEAVDTIIVDDWEEVCRENTDIELMHRLGGWSQANALTLAEAVLGDRLNAAPPDGRMLFSPMGMAIFDIAVASAIAKHARQHGIGIDLE
ncbi:2,3-diaminopropionate biosynthesis protein SbnB [Paenibacillus sp. MMS18-CY102]|uniref:2,3-diaminopropionate biosynthesis protein SbnB n=1 Tax=Paenibacillus sp. MMS18-CY102 TaxID=2682849 RepID=UPI0013656A77|nr:2,3-diaminopropionate biosynthesis protein SbnB [Paenibacillus sp. MMS18-CY102]MWC28701.1 2,3-diaminopropionate biosynthesis protein SbnB [Paenibacillus sp. MMS18-CY102]